MNDGRSHITRLTNKLSRCTQGYANEVLKKYRLGSGIYPFLFILYVKEGINQNQISKELNVDKAMSARSIKQLISLGYLRKEADPEDSRAFKLFLTEAGKAIVPKVKEELRVWDKMITRDLNEQEKEALIELLEKVLNNAKSYNK